MDTKTNENISLWGIVKYLLALTVGTYLAVSSLIHWSENTPIGLIQIFAAIIMYVIAVPMIVWAVSDTIKFLKR